MRPEQRPPTVGIVAALSYVLLAFAPYVLLPETETPGLAIYYDYGIAGPPFLTLLVVVAVVLFAAGRERRTEPDFVAGLVIVLSAVLSLLVFVWALAVPESVVTGLGEALWLEYHRWLLVLTSLATLACSVWYARVLSLF